MYDGLDRRVAIATTLAGKTATTDYIWCGSRICQSRNGSSAVNRLYYPEGEAIPASKALFYYGPDQLGSVRDVYATSPVFSMVQAYDYDPYGNPTKTPPTGPLTDFRYAGMLYHADSGLYMTQYRAYDPRTGRWLSRDPIGEFPSESALLSMVQSDGADPYGGLTRVRADEPLTDFRDAGMVNPADSGLYPTRYRAYDPRTVQWPSLGPIEETGGQNLYGYVDGNPVNAVDLAGLDGTSCPYDPCHGLTGWDCINYLWHQSNPGQHAIWDPAAGYTPPPLPKP
jgi:RHS repeat-associated protein